MESNSEIVRAYFLAIDKCDFEKAAEFLADNFRRYGDKLEYMSKQEALNMLRALKKAMPDLNHVLSNIEPDGPIVRLTAQLGGRHMHPLDLSVVGVGVPQGVVPGSGRMIIFLPNRIEFSLVRGKIFAEKNITPSTYFNGAAGFLQAIGYEG